MAFNQEPFPAESLDLLERRPHAAGFGQASRSNGQLVRNIPSYPQADFRIPQRQVEQA